MILDLIPENDPILSESIPSYNFGFGGKIPIPQSAGKLYYWLSANGGSGLLIK